MNDTKKPNSVVQSIVALMCAIIILKILPLAVYKLKNYTAIPDYVFYILFLLIPAILFFIFIQWMLRKFEIEVNRFVVIALALVAAWPSIKLMERVEIISTTHYVEEDVMIRGFECYVKKTDDPQAEPVCVINWHDIEGIELYRTNNLFRITVTPSTKPVEIWECGTNLTD